MAANPAVSAGADAMLGWNWTTATAIMHAAKPAATA